MAMAMIIAALLAAAVLGDQPPSTAPQTATAEVKPAAAADADPTVCKRGVNSTGSHMRARPICLKKSEWAERERDDRKLVGAIQAGSQVGNKTPGTQN
jgi:hypothetical protein